MKDDNSTWTLSQRRRQSLAMKAAWARRREALAAVKEPKVVPLTALYDAAEKLTEDYDGLKALIVDGVDAEVLVSALAETNHGGTSVQTRLRKALTKFIVEKVQ
jgi:hypothetical protein